MTTATGVGEELPQLAFARHDPPRTRSQRLRWRLKLYFYTAPGTAMYVFTLLVTTLVLRGSSATTAHRVLVEQSTNLHNLRAYPLQVLVTSAFWVGSGWLVLALLPFFIFLAPAERWLGTGFWAAIFALGHVGSTLIVAVVLWFVTGRGQSHRHLLHAVDVGASYGYYAVAAALTYRLPRRWRAWYAIGLGVFLFGTLLYVQTFTQVGHVCSLFLGLACYPMVRRRMPAPGTAGTPADLRLLFLGSDARGRTTLDWALPRCG